MKYLTHCFLSLIVLSLFAPACGGGGIKLEPEYKGVDKRVKDLTDEYIKLANSKGIYFDKTITIGFKDLKDDGTIAQCYYGLGFREIDINNLYWNDMTETNRKSVLFHELTHGYCNRSHDWGNGIPYPTVTDIKLGMLLNDKGVPGHYLDGCPYSIMYPITIEDFCFNVHYKDYMEEMFSRCKVY